MALREADPALRTAPAETLHEAAEDICWAYSVIPPEPSGMGEHNAWSHIWGPFVAEEMEAHTTGLTQYADYARLGDAVAEWKCPEYVGLTWSIAYTHQD